MPLEPSDQGLLGDILVYGQRAIRHLALIDRGIAIGLHDFRLIVAKVGDQMDNRWVAHAGHVADLYRSDSTVVLVKIG